MRDPPPSLAPVAVESPGSDCATACSMCKDDEPAGIRPFDAVAFSLGDLWP